MPARLDRGGGDGARPGPFDERTEPPMIAGLRIRERRPGHLDENGRAVFAIGVGLEGEVFPFHQLVDDQKAVALCSVSGPTRTLPRWSMTWAMA